MPSVFITGTGTDVGKTVATSLLYAGLLERGESVITQKWVQSGAERDIDAHDAIAAPYQEVTFSPELQAARMPYHFPDPVSPHLAAARAQEPIDKDRIHAAWKTLESSADWVLIEGSGGLQVPLSDTQSILDLIYTWEIPLILVVPNIVGAINHSVLSAESIAAKGVTCLGLVMMDIDPATPDFVRADNTRIIESWTRLPVLGEIGYNQGHDPQRMKGILDRLCHALAQKSTTN